MPKERNKADGNRLLQGTHSVVKFLVYDRMARKGSSAYSPRSHSAPHFEGHYVEGMEEWASHYCFNLKEDGTYEAELDEA